MNQDRKSLLLHTERNCVVESIGRLFHYGIEYFMMTMTVSSSTITYSEVGGNREESFKRETRHIALVVTSAE